MTTIQAYVSGRAEANNLHRLSMIDDARAKFPTANRAVIVEVVDNVIDNYCRR